MRGEAEKGEILFAHLDMKFVDGEVVAGAVVLNEPHPYTKTAEFWDEVALFAQDRANELRNPSGPVEPGEVTF